jgi:2-succinyl-6-hydroxy-2,4-cyclohexadiene-1-carboxylate synthase
VAPLHAEVSGTTGGRTTVLAHGFTQTARLWGAFGAALGAGRRLVAVDLPGHGGSSGVAAGLAEGADLLVDVAADRAPFDLVGYSLGARLALHAALAHPEAIGHLVLIGGTAGIEDASQRTARRRRDEALADALEASGDVEDFVTRWLAAPMFAGLPAGAADLAERLRNTAPGLASSLRLAGTGTQEPLWDRLGEVRAAVLVVAGADDPRFAAVGERMARALPHGAFALVPGAGHAAHLHRPAQSARIVTRWLDAAPGAAG